MNHFVPILAALLGSGGIFFPAPGAVEPISIFQPGTRILFQGDSITDGNRGRTEDPNRLGSLAGGGSPRGSAGCAPHSDGTSAPGSGLTPGTGPRFSSCKNSVAFAPPRSAQPWANSPPAAKSFVTLAAANSDCRCLFPAL